MHVLPLTRTPESACILDECDPQKLVMQEIPRNARSFVLAIAEIHVAQLQDN